MNNKKSFSLMEFIIVSTILSLIAVGIMTALFAGIKVWSRAQEVSISEQKTMLVLEDLARAFRQIKKFDDSVLQGETNSFSFPELEHGEFYYVELEYEKGSSSLYRVKKTAKEYQEDSLRKKRKQFLLSIATLKFKYLIESRELAEKFIWVDEYDSEKGKLFAVEIILADDKREYKKTVHLPIVQN